MGSVHIQVQQVFCIRCNWEFDQCMMRTCLTFHISHQQGHTHLGKREVSPGCCHSSLILCCTQKNLNLAFCSDRYVTEWVFRITASAISIHKHPYLTPVVITEAINSQVVCRHSGKGGHSGIGATHLAVGAMFNSYSNSHSSFIVPVFQWME